MTLPILETTERNREKLRLQSLPLNGLLHFYFYRKVYKPSKRDSRRMQNR